MGEILASFIENSLVANDYGAGSPSSAYSPDRIGVIVWAATHTSGRVLEQGLENPNLAEL